MRQSIVGKLLRVMLKFIEKVLTGNVTKLRIPLKLTWLTGYLYTI